MKAVINSAGPIGLGTYRLGKQTYFACRTSLELGYRHLDTTALYRNEAEVARAIADSGIPRREIFVTSKITIEDICTFCKITQLYATIDLHFETKHPYILCTGVEQKLAISIKN